METCERRVDVAELPGVSAVPAVGLDDSRACMVADALAWAVRHNLPLAVALKALPFYTPWPDSQALRVRINIVKDLLYPLRPLAWLTNTCWSWNLRSTIQAIENGDPLSSALERNLRRHFPGFYLTGIAKAERDGLLDTALPVLAAQLRYPAVVAGARRAELMLVTWKLIITLGVLQFVVSTILPPLSDLFTELTANSAMLAGTGSGTIAGWLLGLFVFTLIVVRILSKTEGAGEYVLLKLPFVGTETKMFLLSDLSRSMAVFLRQGEDVLSAAEWSRQATRSQWLKRRLAEFLAAVRNGTPWVGAWDAMKLGTATHRWLIANSAARQDPASGFELLGRWLHQDIEHRTQRLKLWLDPCCTLVVGVVVGTIGYFLFHTLTTITAALALEEWL